MTVVFGCGFCQSVFYSWEMSGSKCPRCNCDHRLLCFGEKDEQAQEVDNATT